MSHKIYVTDHLRRQFVFDGIGADGLDIQLLQEQDERKLFPAIEDADALIVDKTPVTAFTLTRLKRCRIIMRMGIGYDNVAIKTAGENGIYVCNVPDFCIDEVADHTIGLLLSLSRNIVTYHAGLLTGKQQAWSPLLDKSNMRLRGRVLGLVGLGHIGKAVAARAKAFGMEVCFYDPYVDSGYDHLGVTKVDDVHTLARMSDVVSFHLPLLESTRHIADEEFFRNLKRGAILLNTSRGGIVKESALYEALQNGTVAKAGLDVLEQEPINFHEKLFREWLENADLQRRLLITPHAAFHSAESEQDIKMKALNTIRQALRGEVPPNCVNLPYMKRMGAV